MLGDTRLTYAQVNGAANQVANLLVAAGSSPATRWRCRARTCRYFPIVYYGILKAGATVVPLNVLLKGREIAYHLDDSEAKAYFCFEGTAELPIGQEGHAGLRAGRRLRALLHDHRRPVAASPIEGTETLGAAMGGQSPTFETVATDADDTAVILYTSGTTGQPKGAELRHRNLRPQRARPARRCSAPTGNPDTYLCVLPLFHSFGQTVHMNGGFATAAPLVLLPRFEADAALKAMAKEGVTFFAGVPTMYWGLLGRSRARASTSTGSPPTCASPRPAGRRCRSRSIKEFEARFGVTILEGYGLSETSPVATFNRTDRPCASRLDRLADPGASR